MEKENCDVWRFSPLIGTIHTLPSSARMFGNHWRNAVSEVAGIVITTSRLTLRGTTIIQLECVSKRELEEFMEKKQVSQDNKSKIHFFILQESEFINKLQVDFQETRLYALRLETNYRISPVYGRLRTKWETILPPDGYCIDHIFGYTYKLRIIQIKVRYAKLLFNHSIPTHPLSIKDTKIGNLFIQDPNISIKATYKTWIDNPLTMKIACIIIEQKDGILSNINLLSTNQYQAYCLALEPFQLLLSKTEEIYIFQENEDLLSIEMYVHGWRKETKALRFHTNVRISSWYGDFQYGDRVIKNFQDKTQNYTPSGFYWCSMKGLENLGILYSSLDDE